MRHFSFVFKKRNVQLGVSLARNSKTSGFLLHSFGGLPFALLTELRCLKIAQSRFKRLWWVYVYFRTTKIDKNAPRGSQSVCAAFADFDDTSFLHLWINKRSAKIVSLLPTNLATERGCVSLEILGSFLVSVVASVVGYYVCKWLDRDKRSN